MVRTLNVPISRESTITSSGTQGTMMSKCMITFYINITIALLLFGYMGPNYECVDPFTGEHFQLIPEGNWYYGDHDGSANSTLVSKKYMFNAYNITEWVLNNSTAHLAERGWVDCKDIDGWAYAGCSTLHAVGGSIKGVAESTIGAFINAEITNAFSGGRGGQSPRSICHTLDGGNICTSWATYDSSSLQNGESADMAGFAAACVKNGMSAEFKGTDSNGGLIFVCISGRSTGCGQN
ncbi:hypothetical protein V1517DRAFT_310275 [Lipomyces orientalis]|uniref:Uncharacterized protein n=1 Tax=Lipomyces orientalis TaxID=1233043 RepID=A0ACC3TGF1_9ASCO